MRSNGKEGIKFIGLRLEARNFEETVEAVDVFYASFIKVRIGDV